VQHQRTTTPALAVARDLAISAVASDAALVAELIADVSQRLHTTPSWSTGTEIDIVDPLVPFASSTSRVVLVLYHHMWLHDAAVQRDVPLLRERLDEQATSVCVVALDATPLPPWLDGAPRYDLLQTGRDGVAAFVIDAVAAAGGDVDAGAELATDAAPVSRWPEPPPPFLSQQRAQSALRHELDALAEELQTIVDESRAERPDRVFELQIMPQRMVARLDDVAVSFSWLAGRSATVSEGRLLVIGWRGVAAGVKGAAALRSAAVMHERTYVPDGNAPSAWRWRSVDSVSQPYSSANLVGEWMARASIARAG
jgi:hypothetical protein